jgi:RND family efflux transporter MFP subunit
MVPGSPRAATLTAILLAAAAPAFPAAGQGGPPPASVFVEPVQIQNVQDHRRVTGELRARRRARVATQEGGLVVELPVEEGMAVKAGDILAKLDARRLELLKSEVQADLAGAEAQVEERQALLAWRTRDLELIRASMERGGANPRELADASSQEIIAKALALHAQRQVEVIKARIELLDERLADMTIRAPYDGAVVARHVELGEWVDEGGAVVELVTTDRLEAWLEVPQRFLGAVSRPEVEIAITVEAANRSIKARSVRVIPLVDPRARSFYSVADIAGAEAKGLAPGMSVMAWVPSGVAGDHMVISRNAILRNEAGAYVYVAGGSGADAQPANAMPVQVHEMFPIGARTVVASAGLREGDLVIVEGNERLFPMAPVIPIEQDPAGPGPTAGSSAARSTTVEKAGGS